MALTAKQQRFIEEYLIDLNGTQAAIRAGYSENSANEIASENLAKPNIQEAIAAERAKISERCNITVERVLNEYAKMAFSNMANYITIQDDGSAYIDLSGVTRDDAAALAEVVTEEYKDGRGEDARDVKRVKIKLSDKKAALDSISRHLGMFADKIDVTSKGESIKTMDDRELAIRAAMLMQEQMGKK